jgi:hypothetical protein
MPDDALRMLDLFCSVGTQQFDVTFTDIFGKKAQKEGFLGNRTIPSMRFNLPGKWRKRIAELIPVNIPEKGIVMAGENLIMRPHDAGPVKFVQLDDLKDAERVKPAAFMIIETSPGNHQAWLAVNAADSDFVRRLRKGTGADPTASGATRVAGTQNFKTKYAPYFPVIAITQAEPGRIVTPSQLESMGLVAPVEIERKKPTFIVATARRRTWPSYQRCLQGVKPKHSGDGLDMSRVDYTFARIAATWGFTAEEIMEKLLEVSEHAQHESPGYAERTAKRAAGDADAEKLRARG